MLAKRSLPGSISAAWRRWGGRSVARHEIRAHDDAPEAPVRPGGVEVVNVDLAREGRPVLRDLSFTLRERRIGVVGRNGSGKSSFVRLVAGLQRPDRGTLRVEGIEVGRDRRAALHTVGVIFQNPDHQIIFPTVSEELAFGLEQQGLPRPEARDRALWHLESYGLAEWLDRPTHLLSHGQRQFLCILSVLAMRPSWIVLDEPFTGLDLPTTSRIEAEIAAMSQHVILITHDPARLAGFDRVVWFEAGRIAGDGNCEAVLDAYTEEMQRAGGRVPC